MGVKIISIGADFSGLALGKVIEPTAFFAAIPTLTSVEKNAVSNLVDALVIAGIYSKFKAIYPFVGSSASAHKFNLLDPRDLNAAYRLSFLGSGNTHTALGYNGNGTGRGDTFYKPPTNVGLHFSFYNTSSQGVGLPLGLMHPTQNNAFWLSRNFGNRTTTSVGGAITMFPTDAGYDRTKKGLLMTQRRSSTDLKLYDNGVQIGSSGGGAGSSFTENPNNFCIGAIHNSVSPGTIDYLTNVNLGFVAIGEIPLTDSEIVIYSDAVVAFQTALGRA